MDHGVSVFVCVPVWGVAPGEEGLMILKYAAVCVCGVYAFMYGVMMSQSQYTFAYDKWSFVFWLIANTRLNDNIASQTDTQKGLDRTNVVKKWHINFILALRVSILDDWIK